MKRSSKRSKPPVSMFSVTDALSLFPGDTPKPSMTAGTPLPPSAPSPRVAIDGQWFLELRQRFEAGTLTQGDIRELISTVVRLRVAVALLNDEIAKLRGSNGQV